MIIKNRTISDDNWTVFRLSGSDTPKSAVVPPGKVIVPLKVWQAQRDVLQVRTELGVWLASDERAEDLKNELAKFSIIAVDFPKFSDGRGYTIAHHLRARLGYSGELRAIGDVLRDQMFYLQRVGFDAYVTRFDKDIAEALKGLNDFSFFYQASSDESLPLFRRVQRGGEL
ncbi:MAG: DUF934 domain-containing protein [Gallionella sp.]